MVINVKEEAVHLKGSKILTCSFISCATDKQELLSMITCKVK